MSSLIRILLCVAICSLAASGQAQSPPSSPVPLRGGWNLPVWAAQRQGYFEGLAVELSHTPNSAFLVTRRSWARDHEAALIGFSRPTPTARERYSVCAASTARRRRR